MARVPPAQGLYHFPALRTVGRCHSGELAYAAAATIAKELEAVGINMNMAPVLDVNTAIPTIPSLEPGLRLLAETVIEMGLVTAAGSRIPRSWPVENISPAMRTRTPIRTRSCRWSRRPQAVGSRRVSSVSPCRHRGNRHADDSPCPLQGAGRPASGDPLPDIITPAARTDALEQVVLTDDLEMHAIVDHYGPGEAAVRAFLAGCDMLLICKERDREIAAPRPSSRRVRDHRHGAAGSVGRPHSATSATCCRTGRRSFLTRD